MAQKNNRGGRPSYITEIRNRYNDPNYFNRTPISELQKQTNRIISDIRYGKITEEDLIYFSSRNLLDALINECYVRKLTAEIHAKSMRFYCAFYNKPGYNVYASPMGPSEIVEMGNVLTKDEQLYNIYTTFYNAFTSIKLYNADVKNTLTALQNFNFDPRIFN